MLTPGGELRRQIGSFGSFARIQKEKQQEEEQAALALAARGGGDSGKVGEPPSPRMFVPRQQLSQYDQACSQYELGSDPDGNRARTESHCSHIDDDDPPSY
jgi:hypothetical protein